jgi:hypothetical protein
MSCKQNDILADLAIDKVEAIMELNPSIPKEMRKKLEEEMFKSLKEDEGDPGDYEPNTPEEMDKADAYWESLRKGEE